MLSGFGFFICFVLSVLLLTDLRTAKTSLFMWLGSKLDSQEAGSQPTRDYFFAIQTV